MFPGLFKRIAHIGTGVCGCVRVRAGICRVRAVFIYQAMAFACLCVCLFALVLCLLRLPSLWEQAQVFMLSWM